jgi:hypothetical protein
MRIPQSCRQLQCIAGVPNFMEKSKDCMEKSKDQDRSKGATEQDSENEGGNTSMQGQLGHRDQDADIKDADSDQPG